MPPWSSQLAADLRDERVVLLVTFLELRALLRNADESAFAGGAAERARLLRTPKLTTSRSCRRGRLQPGSRGSST
jgi:hypothetical protein